MKPCYLCSDSFNENLFTLHCGCQFHVFCLKSFFIHRIIYTCPKCGAYVKDEEETLLEKQDCVKRKKMCKTYIMKEPNLPYCYFCRRVFDGKKIFYRLNICEHFFHATCLKMYGEICTKCPIDGIDFSDADLEYLHINQPDLMIEDEWKDCIIISSDDE